MGVVKGVQRSMDQQEEQAMVQTDGSEGCQIEEPAAERHDGQSRHILVND